MTTRYLICGGRDFEDYGLMASALKSLILAPHDAVIIHGAYRGADTLADRWAKCNGAQVEPYPADWRSFGPAAGPMRNKLMLDAKPDVVIAFPGGAGTRDMIFQARQMRIVVIEVIGKAEDWSGEATS